MYSSPCGRGNPKEKEMDTNIVVLYTSPCGRGNPKEKGWLTWSEFLEEHGLHSDFKALEARWRLFYDDSDPTWARTQREWVLLGLLILLRLCRIQL